MIYIKVFFSPLNFHKMDKFFQPLIGQKTFQSNNTKIYETLGSILLLSTHFSSHFVSTILKNNNLWDHIDLNYN